MRGMEQREAGSSHPHFCPIPQALKDLKGQTEAIPCIVGDEEVWTSSVQYQLSVGLTRAGSSSPCTWGSPWKLTGLELRSLPVKVIIPSQSLTSVDA